MLDYLLEKSLLGYTKLGYHWRHLEGRDDLRILTGRTIVITGATGGLGEATAEALARKQADLVLVGRDPVKLAAVAAKTLALGAGHVQTERVDLSVMAEVAALGRRLCKRGDIDVLVNNAGVLLNERRLTPEGVEATFATNLLGHYLLTELLWPVLAAREDARVVNVSSGGMYTQRIRPDDPETEHMPYNGPQAYARTKRAQVILTERWAARYPGVAVYALHPGWADTAGVQTALPGFRRLTRPLLRSAEEGADTTVWLAGGQVEAGLSGCFFHDRRVRKTHRMASTRETLLDRDELESALNARLDRLLGAGWREEYRAYEVPAL